MSGRRVGLLLVALVAAGCVRTTPNPPFTPITAAYSAWVTSNFPMQNPRLIVTCVCGPSDEYRAGSLAGLPIVKVPAGIDTMFGPPHRKSSCPMSGVIRLETRSLITSSVAPAGRVNVYTASSRCALKTLV